MPRFGFARPCRVSKAVFWYPERAAVVGLRELAGRLPRIRPAFCLQRVDRQWSFLDRGLNYISCDAMQKALFVVNWRREGEVFDKNQRKGFEGAIALINLGPVASARSTVDRLGQK